LHTHTTKETQTVTFFLHWYFARVLLAVSIFFNNPLFAEKKVMPKSIYIQDH